MRPRRVGTFLMSRRPTSAKLSARSRIASISSRRELLDREQVLHATDLRGLGSEIVTSSTPSISSRRTLTRSLERGRQVLADVVGAERQLAVAAVAEDGELDPLRAAVVEEGVDRGAHGAAGEEDVVDEDDGALAEVEVDVGGVDDRLRGGRLGADVVAVEGDVEVADRQLGRRSARRGRRGGGGPGRRRGCGCRRGQIPGESGFFSTISCAIRLSVRPRSSCSSTTFSLTSSLPSWPHGTGLKDGRSSSSEGGDGQESPPGDRGDQ